MGELDKLTVEKKELALASAYLLTQGKRQTEIMEILEIKSQAEVSRLINIARADGCLPLAMHWPPGTNREAIEARAFSRTLDLQNLLTRRANRNQGVEPKTHVVFSGTSDDGLQKFGRLAGSIIAPWIVESKRCAVAWGRTIETVINSLPKQSADIGSAGRDRCFFPISGEPLNHPPTGMSPSFAAARLAESFGAERTYSLQGVPARIPREMDAKAAVIREFAEMCDDYNDIFGERRLIREVDMIISGIGDVETSKDDPWVLETEAPEEFESLQEMTAGNLGGVWLPKDRTDEEQVEKIDKINGRWLGIEEIHLKDCAERAARSPSSVPGVVVLAFEPRKARVIAEAIGLVNHLVISEALALELINLLEASG